MRRGSDSGGRGRGSGAIGGRGAKRSREDGDEYRRGPPVEPSPKRGGGYRDSSPPRGSHRRESGPPARDDDNLMDIVNAVVGAPKNDSITRSYREIYLANPPTDVPVTQLRDYIGGAMQKMGLSSTLDENPVDNLQMGGRAAFLQMKTVEDAANLLNLDGIPLKGTVLRFQRIKTFDGGVAGVSYFNWEEIYSQWLSGELRMRTAGVPTRVIRIHSLATSEQFNAQPNLNFEIEQELRQELAHLHIRSVTTIRPNASQTNDKDVGKVFIEMNNIEDAKAAMMTLKGRSYNGRLVDLKFFPEDRFRQQQWGFELPRMILTSSFGTVQKETILNAAALAKVWKEESAQTSNTASGQGGNASRSY